MKTSNFRKVISIFLSCIMILGSMSAVFAADAIPFEDGVRIKTSVYTAFEGGAPSQKNGGTALSIGKALYYDLIPPEAGVYLLELQHKRNSSWNINIEAAFTEGSSHELIKKKTLQVSTANSSNSSDDWDTEAGNAYWEEIGYATFSDTSMRTLMISNRNTGSNNGPWTGAIRLTKLKPVGLNAAYANDAKIDGTISEYTDAVTFKFDGKLEENVLDKAQAMLTDENGKEILSDVYSVNSDKSEVVVAICETLNPGENYKLSISGFKDAYGYPAGSKMHEFEISFATVEDTNNTITSELNVEPFRAENMVFEIQGIVTGSLGQPIKGRTVNAEVLAPKEGAEPKQVESTVTDDDGKFTLTYEISEEEKEIGGDYKFTVSSPFAEDAVESGLYVSDSMIQSIVGSADDMSGDELQSLLEGESGTQIGFDYTEVNELLGEENASAFYTRLASASFKNKDGDYDIMAFENACSESLIIEDMLINGAEAVKKYLDDADVQTKIGIEAGKYALLTDDGAKNDFIEEIDAIETIENLEELGEKCNAVIDEYVLKQYKKSKFTLSLSDVSTLKNKAVDIPLNASPYSMDVSKFTISIECPDEDSADSLEIKDIPAGTSSKKVSGNVAEFTVSGIPLNKTITGFGIPVFSYGSKGTVTLKVSGKVTYCFEDIEIVDEINDSQVSVSVTESSTKSSKTSSSRGGGGGTYAPVTPPEVLPSTNPNEVVFNDLGSASWAEDSIYALAKKGIISRAEDGKFRPNDSVSRAEFVKMLAIALNLVNSGTDMELSDVPNDAWYYLYFKVAYINHLVTGDQNGNFNPEDKITRQDMCVIMDRALDMLKIETAGADIQIFTDDGSIAPYAKDAVYRMRKHNVVNGIGDGSFAPQAEATRAATAKMIYEFMEEAMQ